MSTKAKIEKIEAKIVICPICKKEITNMKSEYCEHLLRWDDVYAHFITKNENRGMKREDIKFLHGKGHICNYCDSNKEPCHSVRDIKKYAQEERNISEMSIQIFACSLFKKEET